MKTFNQAGGAAVLAVLVVTNVLIYSALPWLRAMDLGADSSDPVNVHDGQPIPAAPLLRNVDYLGSFVEKVNERRGVFCLGTSESIVRSNLAAQLNSLSGGKPQMIVAAKGGVSPIHSCLAFAAAKEAGIDFPPMVVVVNPVYFTRSHDVIKEGWIGQAVRSPVFVQLNHRGIMDLLPAQVQAEYRAHCAWRSLLHPLVTQEYVGNLLYLLGHRATGEEIDDDTCRMQAYDFDGTRPVYDEQANVPPGYTPTDQMLKSRWLIAGAEESVNLKGVEAIAELLRDNAAGVLFLVLPVNRTFYRHNGLDMKEFDGRYKAIRARLAGLATQKDLCVIDLFESPELDCGFRDRMHLDEYGTFQVANYLLKLPEYIAFVEAARCYYDNQDKMRGQPTP